MHIHVPPVCSHLRSKEFLMVARAPQTVCAFCGRRAHRGDRSTAGSSADSEHSFDFELLTHEDRLERSRKVASKWERVVRLLRRLAFKRRCWGHFGQWLQVIKRRGLQQ